MQAQQAKYDVVANNKCKSSRSSSTQEEQRLLLIKFFSRQNLIIVRHIRNIGIYSLYNITLLRFHIRFCAL